MATPKSVTFGTYRTDQPEWLQSSITAHRVIVPGGIYLDPTGFNVAPYIQTDGRIEVPSGTPIYRTIDNMEASRTNFLPLLDAAAIALLAGNLELSQIGITYGTTWDLNDDGQCAMIQAQAGNQILENFLPNQTKITANVKAVLRRAGFFLMIGKP